eukprot:348651-Pyramimonas_sp.AAC.1
MDFLDKKFCEKNSRIYADQSGADDYKSGHISGFAELEYGMLRYMGAIDDSTVVVTSVHDEQLVDNIPLDKITKHDVAVDIICTPTR